MLVAGGFTSSRRSPPFDVMYLVGEKVSFEIKNEKEEYGEIDEREKKRKRERKREKVCVCVKEMKKNNNST